MATYVVDASPETIDFEHAAIQAAVDAQLGCRVEVYRPHTFVEHSGFSETVREEIQLVLGHGASRLDFDTFVDAWGFRSHLDRRVLNLSGGWRKFLGLALFMNRPFNACLLFDATSHLSDVRVRVLLTRASDIQHVVFVEYDPTLLAGVAGVYHPLQPLIVTKAGGQS